MSYGFLRGFEGYLGLFQGLFRCVFVAAEKARCGSEGRVFDG